MNPALLNYYQQMQANQGGQGQGAAMPPAPASEPYNPFDAGIGRAIESARESMGMSRKQQDRAMRNSLLSFAQNMSQQPKEKGFFANFANAGKALAPALNAYDEAEDEALTSNNALATQILQQRAQEQNRLTSDDDRMWKRQMAEKQFNESVRQHNLLDNFRERSLTGRGHAAEQEERGHGMSSADEGLYKLLDESERIIREQGDKSQRGRLGRIAGKVLPGGYQLNEEQSTINTLGDILRGKLFNAWGYKNQAEFEHVPSISADNPPEVNLAIIRQLKQMLGGYTNNMNPGNVIDDGMVQPQEGMTGDVVTMRRATGETYQIPINEVPDAEKEGLTIVR
jgi:hypothetical protein